MSDSHTELLERADGLETSAQLSVGGADGGDPNVGRVLDGKYRMDKLIGVGGMGRVYSGVNLRTDSPVAIKTLNPELIEDENLVKRFEVEAKIVANLSHPNTIRTYDFGQDAGMLFMVMELLNGESLDDRIETGGAMPPRRAIAIMREVLGSLSEAHAAGLVHRDLKPDNIFLNRVGGNEHVKVLDFGVAKLKENKYNDNNTLTQFGMIFGTPRYMSPEQAKAADLDARSDIYALGVILFEMVTGAVPFDANDPVSILIQHVQEPAPRPSGFVPGIEVHVDLEEVILTCMAKEADDRFKTVEEFAAVLDIVDGKLAAGDTSSYFTEANPPTVAATEALKLSPEDRLGIGGGTAMFQSGVATKATALLPSHGAKIGGLPRGLVLIVAALLVAVVGVAVMLLTSSGGDAVAASDDPFAESVEVDEAPALAVVAAIDPTDAIRKASREINSSILNANRSAELNVVRIEVSVANVEGATIRLRDSEDEPAALPHTFLRARASEDAEPLVVVVEAPGYEPMEQSFSGRTSDSRSLTLSRRAGGRLPASPPAAGAGTRPPSPQPSPAATVSQPAQGSRPPAQGTRQPPAPGADRLMDFDL